MYDYMVLGQFLPAHLPSRQLPPPPRKLSPGLFPPRKIAPLGNSPRQFPPRTIVLPPR